MRSIAALRRAEEVDLEALAENRGFGGLREAAALESKSELPKSPRVRTATRPNSTRPLVCSSSSSGGASTQTLANAHTHAHNEPRGALTRRSAAAAPATTSANNHSQWKQQAALAACASQKLDPMNNYCEPATKRERRASASSRGSVEVITSSTCGSNQVQEL